jgi:hypothetical protein
MARLKVKVARQISVSRESGIAFSLSRMLTGECTAPDIRKISSTIPGAHPYLGYLNSKPFTDDELLERQEEAIGAVVAAVKGIFRAVKSNVVTVANKSVTLPVPLKWIVPGDTWGEIAGMVAAEAAISTILSKIIKMGKVDTEGVTDHAGITQKLAEIPPGSTMKLRKPIWPGDTPLSGDAVADQLFYISAFFDKLTTMAKTLPSVMDGKQELDLWLSPLKGKGGNDVWVVRPIHQKKGFIIYRNADKMFCEAVVSDEKYPTQAVYPNSRDLMYVQKAVKEVLKSARGADKAVRSVLKRYDTPAEANKTGEALAADNKAVSNQETDKATTKQGQEDTDAKTSARNKKADGVFAFNVVKSLFEDSSPLAVEAMKDAGQYLNDSIAAILMYTPEDANESPLNKELNKSDAKPNPSNKGETKPSKPSPYADVAKKGDS